MFENQALEPRIFEDLERVRGSSTPNPGTIQDLTFNLFSILADQRLSANALFWITVWITPMDHGPRAKVQTPRSMVHGPCAAGRGFWISGWLWLLAGLFEIQRIEHNLDQLSPKSTYR